MTVTSQNLTRTKFVRLIAKDTIDQRFRLRFGNYIGILIQLFYRFILSRGKRFFPDNLVRCCYNIVFSLRL